MFTPVRWPPRRHLLLPVLALTVLFRVGTGPGHAQIQRPQMWQPPSRARAGSCRFLSRASDGNKIKARVEEPIKIDLKYLRPQISNLLRCAARQWTAHWDTQEFCLYHWNRRCVVHLNNIPIFIRSLLSQYHCKTLFLSFLIRKPTLVLLDSQSNSSISFAD